MLRKLKPSAARHVGRTKQRYAFEIAELHVASGLPTALRATGLVVQCSRGAKITTTKEVAITPEAKAAGGGLTWHHEKLSFVATLFSSKTGKETGFSDKRYKVAVLAVKPMFGTAKSELKEVASCLVNISDYTSASAP